jgi:hypothetical protein
MYLNFEGMFRLEDCSSVKIRYTPNTIYKVVISSPKIFTNFARKLAFGLGLSGLIMLHFVVTYAFINH